MLTELKFRTLGNATIQCIVDGHPILTTDPWLVGRAYFDSWSLHHPMTHEELRSCIESDFIWISHGHPDHLHMDSLAMLPTAKRVLIPNHYTHDIYHSLLSLGFQIEVLKYRQWITLSDHLDVLCLDNMTQDAILVIKFGDALLINLNDSPFCGEFDFLRRLVRAHSTKKTFAFRLCAVSADMLNLVNEREERIIEPPERYKVGAIHACADQLARLEVRYFCPSSSQHIFVRPDSKWANDYDINISDLRRYWNQTDVQIIDPFVTFDLNEMKFVRNWPQEKPAYYTLKRPGQDDWNERLLDSEWNQVENFFAQFYTISGIVNFIDVRVGGEKRRVFNSPPWLPWRKKRGICFTAPKDSLLKAIKSGYFDDLLIGNFMKTELINVRLYPDFTPRIAKLGAVKIFTRFNMIAFVWHYARRNPWGILNYLLTMKWNGKWLPAIIALSERLGVRPFAKWIYRKSLFRVFQVIFRG